MTMWGLTATGLFSVNVMDATVGIISATTSAIIPLKTWTHIAQRFSTVKGNSLYVNGVLVATSSAPNAYSIGPFVFVGASPSGTSACLDGLIATGQFFGIVDEFHVFGRELDSNDICWLAHP